MTRGHARVKALPAEDGLPCPTHCSMVARLPVSADGDVSHSLHPPSVGRPCPSPLSIQSSLATSMPLRTFRQQANPRRRAGRPSSLISSRVNSHGRYDRPRQTRFGQLATAAPAIHMPRARTRHASPTPRLPQPGRQRRRPHVRLPLPWTSESLPPQARRASNPWRSSGTQRRTSSVSPPRKPPSPSPPTPSSQATPKSPGHAQEPDRSVSAVSRPISSEVRSPISPRPRARRRICVARRPS